MCPIDCLNALIIRNILLTIQGHIEIHPHQQAFAF
jgi:hypothetical protein